MRLNRRDFVRIGSMGTAAVLGSALGGCDRRPRLEIRIKGLSLVRSAGQMLTVHFVNGPAVGLGDHLARLFVPANLIDPIATTAAYTQASANAPLEFDLGGQVVTVPGTGTQPPDVTITNSAIGSAVPTTPAQWASVRHAVHLSSFCNGTFNAQPQQLNGSVQINHGELKCVPPDSAIGGVTVWRFKNGAQQIGNPQAMSDVLSLSTRINASGPVFTIGNQHIVFKPGLGGQVTLSNMPQMPQHYVCPNGQPVCADHAGAYFKLVNPQCNIVVEKHSGSAPPPGIDPSYCPPAFGP